MTYEITFRNSRGQYTIECVDFITTYKHTGETVHRIKLEDGTIEEINDFIANITRKEV